MLTLYRCLALSAVLLFSHTARAANHTITASWGSNQFGQLGNGTTTNGHVPAAVRMDGALAGKTIVAMAGGKFHSLALASDGTVYAWGYNATGELGNGGNPSSKSKLPVAVKTDGALSGKT